MGLPALADRKPILLLGGDISDFLTARKRPPERCRLNECYCVKCRLPRAPLGGVVDYMPITATSGNLRGICPTCDTLMHKRISLEKWAAMSVPSAADMEASSPISDLTPPSLNEHLQKAG